MTLSTVKPQGSTIDPAKACDDWLPSAIKEIHLFWLDVHAVNPIAGYLLLFSVFFLIWYALYSLNPWAKGKKIDIELDKAFKKSGDA